MTFANVSISSGLVIPAMNGGENQLNTDFYNELISEMHKIGGQVTYQKNKGWFNPELLKLVLDNMMSKANVECLFNIDIDKITLENNTIKQIYIKQNMLSEYIATEQRVKKLLFEPICARYVIDSTGNCEIGKICNCKFLNSKDEVQPISLRFIMSGIDLAAFSKWLLEFDSDREVTTAEDINGQIHLSTAYTWDSKGWALKPIFDKAVADGVLKVSDTNYFQIFTIAGMPDSIAFNCPRIVDDIDINNPKELSNALIAARQSIYRLSEFCKKYLIGFEKSFISNIADQLGVRASNRIKGKYVYTIEDLKSGKTFEHPVLRSSYPVDVHSAKKDNSTLEKVKQYELPIESLMSDDIDNLFVIGRCLSADFLAQGALRIQPSCFSMGEGVAKYIASKSKH